MNKEVEQNTQDKLEQYVNYLNTLDKTFKGLSTEQDRTELKTQYESGKYHKFHRTELNGGISEWVITEGNVEEFYLKSDINSFNCTHEYILLSTDELEETLRELESKMNKESIKINLKDTYCKATEENLEKLRLDVYTSNIFTEHIGKGYFFVQDFENELHATFIDEASLSNGLINYFKRITLNKDNVWVYSWVYSEEPKTEPEQEPKQESLSLIKPESLTGTISQDKISEILVKAIGKGTKEDINDDSIRSIMYYTFKQDKVDIVINEKLDDEFETEILYRVNHETLIKVIHEYLKDKGIDVVYTERHNKEEYHIWINEKESTISFRYNKDEKEKQ